MGRKYDTLKDVISKFKLRHGCKYDYGRVNYIDSKTKVEIVCPTHGSFMMSPNHHNSGRGCKECFKLRKSELQKLSYDDVIVNFVGVHGNFYDYSKVEYKDDSTKVLIICNEHGEFHQTPKNHKKGHRCPECAKDLKRAYLGNLTSTERTKISPAYLYQVKLESANESFTKIGVSVNPNHRFTQFTGYKVTESYIKEYANMELAYGKECELHSKLKKYKYKPLRKFYGSRECYIFLNYCTF